jgi:DNA (cytosine-5)-methyltransferase 1
VRLYARQRQVTLTVGSLFSGIGGLDLGLERVGMKVIWQSEIDPYGCQVLKKHWPEVVNHGNIKEIKWGNIVRPDIICGGYPCQPFSTAGKRNGADDPRHLWPWVREAISELRPKYAILENVRGHITLGLSEVLGELAGIGYDAEWQIVSANSVGAPHLRERIIIVAYPFRQLANTDNSGCLYRQPQIFTANRWLNALSFIGTSGTNVADTTKQHSNGKPNYSGNSKQPETVSEFGDSGWAERANNWQVEPDVGRVANGVPSRVDRLRGLGNAVVPQVAELIGRMVIDYDTNQ